MSNTVNAITIRMYHTGSVGDCLLLQFKNDKNVTANMLIDCGGFQTNAAAITNCVNDIKTRCNGKLDVLVMTHQHEDHVSGFNLAKSVFDTFTVDEVWMSWIEDETDPVSKIVRDKIGKKIKELKALIQKAVKGLSSVSTAPSGNLHSKRAIGLKKAALNDAMEILDFEAGSSPRGAAAGGIGRNETAIRYLRKKGKKLKFHLPGSVKKDLPGMEGLQFYFLGPPRDKDLILLKTDEEDDEMYKNIRSRAAKKADETDEDGNGESLEQFDPFQSTGVLLTEKVSPFDAKYKADGEKLTELNKDYNSADMKWRQIETDYLESAASIALRLTNLVNNTSLAFAIENKASGKVLLFPADAQSGNWMSWHTKEVSNKLKDRGGKTTHELLENTVLYKVGHHGSHNGTASRSGLDMMTRSDLVAMIPLVQDKVPKVWGGAKNFPAKGLYRMLIDKTKGRMIRTDEGIVTDSTATDLRSKLPASDRNAFNKNFVQGDCFVEYTVSLK